jgi:transposase
MLYIGLDIHKETTFACVKSETGMLVWAEKFPSSPRSIGQFLDRVEERREGPASIVMEATGFCFYIYDIIEMRGHFVKVAHPSMIKKKTTGSAKTDKRDAELLVDRHRLNDLVYSYILPVEDRPLRSETRYRQELVHDKARMKNRIQAILIAEGRKVPPSMKSSFTKKHMAWLRTLDNRIVNDLLDLLQVIMAKIDACDASVEGFCENDRRIALLKTIPGIGDVLAPALAAELGDINRFHSAQSVACYAGIVPMIHQSGKTEHHGPITKSGNGRLRYLLVEAVLAHIRFAPDSPITRFYNLKKDSKGSKKARIAAARKLLAAIYHMLKEDQSFTLIDTIA